MISLYLKLIEYRMNAPTTHPPHLLILISLPLSQLPFHSAVTLSSCLELHLIGLLDFFLTQFYHILFSICHHFFLSFFLNFFIHLFINSLPFFSSFLLSQSI
jgi:hypothetical protein